MLRAPRHWKSVLCILTAATCSAAAHESAFHRRVAEFHAPVVIQETGTNPTADAFTRFDFDGDLDPNNNWKNTGKHPTPAYSYYEVFETRSHFLISYSFFHSRDYSRVCLPRICHENDLEGVLFVVKKNGGYGALVAIETLAHDVIRTYVEFVRDPQQRPLIYIEPGGHGIYGAIPELDGRKYIRYTYGATADDPRGAKAGSFRYDLLQVYSEFWLRRGSDSGMFLQNFDYGGSRFDLGAIPINFDGKKWATGRARPPWAWKDKNDSVLKRGDWFLDPAYSVQQRLKLENFSTQYLRNPYIPK